MDASCVANRVRAVASALLLAGAALGSADALIAAWHSAGIVPARTLPLCLTAPLPIALVVLFPAAALWALAPSRALGTVRPLAANLIGVAGGLAALRGFAATSLAEAFDGASLLAAGVVACTGFGIARALARAALARFGRARLVSLVVLAALAHGAALCGVVWQWRHEGRGLEADLLAAAGLVSRSRDRSVVAGSRGDGAVVAASGGAATAPLAPENLLLVTIDTLRADHLDDARMPRTSALARDGVRLTQAFAASSWTLPSVASLLTGLSVARHGAGAPRGLDPLSRAPLDGGAATLATVLRRAGFATRAVVTNPYLGVGYGLARGFDAYENVTLESEAVLTLAPTIGFATLARLAPALAVVDRGDVVTSRAERFLRGAPVGRFFLWLHYVDPHAPYDGATRSFRDELVAGGGATTRLPSMARLRAGEVRPGPAERAALRDAYARAVRFADEQVGTISDLLEETGLARRTLLVVTADHGEELWEHGGVEHGHTLYDEVVRVPLVIRCPGCAARARSIDAPVATTALAATLLDLLHVTPAGEAGERVPVLEPASGFAPLLRGDPWTASPILSESLLFAEERIALRTVRHTYVLWPSGKEELYDRVRDPGELRDLAARSALVREQRRLLAASRDHPVASSGPTAHDRPPPRREEPRVRRALAVLGYLE